MNERKKEYILPPFKAYYGSDEYIVASYSPRDEDIVYPELSQLERFGYRIWYAGGIKLEEQTRDVIAEAISKSSLFVVFITENAVNSPQVKSEIHLANVKEIEILPIYLEDMELPTSFELEIGGKYSLKKFELKEEFYLKKIKEILPQKLTVASENKSFEEDSLLMNSYSRSTYAGLRRDTEVIFSYDVYITFKNVDDNGNPTYDSVDAFKLFKYLSEKGLRVFHAAESIKDLSDTEAIKAIEDARNSSQIMLLVAKSPKNVTDYKKVSEDWKAFSKAIRDKTKPDGLLISYINGFEKSLLPEMLQRHKVITEEEGSLDKLFRLISSKVKIKSDAIDAKSRTTVNGDTQENLTQKLIEDGCDFCFGRIGGDGNSDEVVVSLGDTINIGRYTDNNIILKSKRVSRWHAKIVYNKDGIFVEDLNSSNGTYVNGVQLISEKPKKLTLRDVISFPGEAYHYKLIVTKSFGKADIRP